ncbi:MAG: metal-dependent transcriptional regulator [Oscillospiraceae bacterium]|jgi:DtxR family Mn-dependent transcriptional regulator
MKKITPSKEDYLKTLLILSLYDTEILSKDVSAVLGVTKASVSRMMGILKSEGYISMEKYGTATLTEKGKMTADSIKLKYDILKAFLIDVLGVDSKTAEQDACRLEHVVSDETMSCVFREVKEMSDLRRRSHAAI